MDDKAMPGSLLQIRFRSLNRGIALHRFLKKRVEGYRVARVSPPCDNDYQKTVQPACHSARSEESRRAGCKFSYGIPPAAAGKLFRSG